MAESDDTLSRRAAQAIAALLTAQSIGEAARLSGVAERTLHRWLAADTHFQARYREARRAVVQQAVSQIQRATAKAVATLVAVMDDADAPASARVSAAKVVLEQALRGIELEDIEARVAALEAFQHAGVNGASILR